MSLIYQHYTGVALLDYLWLETSDSSTILRICLYRCVIFLTSIGSERIANSLY
jgi:hypothetical protein